MTKNRCPIVGPYGWKCDKEEGHEGGCAGSVTVEASADEPTAEEPDGNTFDGRGIPGVPPLHGPYGWNR